MNGLTKAASDVLAERQRQMEREGWTPEHDDEHNTGELARAAAAYCLTETDVPVIYKLMEADRPIWPWSIGWYKPKDRRANMVRAAALLLAEIERLDRNREVLAQDQTLPADGHGPEPETVYEKSARWTWPDGRPDL